MVLDDETRMVDVLGRYTIVADNNNGSVDASVTLKYAHRPPPSLNGSANESDTSWYPPPSDSEFSQTFRPNLSANVESSDTETTVRDYELHINSTDTD